MSTPRAVAGIIPDLLRLPHLRPLVLAPGTFRRRRQRQKLEAQTGLWTERVDPIRHLPRRPPHPLLPRNRLPDQRQLLPDRLPRGLLLPTGCRSLLGPRHLGRQRRLHLRASGPRPAHRISRLPLRRARLERIRRLARRRMLCWQPRASDLVVRRFRPLAPQARLLELVGDLQRKVGTSLAT